MEERRRLTRDREDRMLGGVCSGIAKHFDLDPTLVRVVFVILAFVSGVGIIAYVLLWLLLPAGDRPEVAARQVMRENVDEIAERARLAAASAQAAAEAARQAADQLAETARAAGRAARDTWQQGSQPGSQQGPEQGSQTSSGDAAEGASEASEESGGLAAPMDAATAEGSTVGSESSTPAGTSGMAAEGALEREGSGKPGQTTPEGSQTAWPPSRDLPSTDASPEPPAAESAEGQSSAPPRI